MKNARIILLSASLALAGSLSSYGVMYLGVNFGANEDGAAMSSSDVAGLVGNEGGNELGSTQQSNWNNLSNASGSSSSLLYSNGSSASGVSVSWSSSNTYSLPNVTGGTNSTASTTLMKGYIEGNESTDASVTFSGLSATEPYSVIVYADGANNNVWKLASYTIGGESAIIGDTEDTNFNSGTGDNPNGLFQVASPGGSGGTWPIYPENNTEGNIYIFSGVTGSSFTLTVHATESGTGEYLRSVLNGVQVVVPEPSTYAGILGGLVLIVAWLRRKRAR